MRKRELQEAAVYCRVSTQKYSQDESIERQQKDGYSAAEELGYSNIKVYVDRKTGTTVGRKGYQQMLQKMESDLVAVVIVKDLDRLNRNTLDWYLFLKVAQEHGVKIYFYLTRKFYEVTDKIIIGVKALLAEEYSRSLSEKSNDAHRKRQNEGGSAIFTNNVWGYKTIYYEDGSKKLVIDEKEAQMIRLIFQYIIEGKGVHRISKILYDLGYKNHNGKQLGNSVILAIIRNPKVVGDIIVNKTHFDFETKKTIKNPKEQWIYLENVVPGILDRSIYEKANSILDSRAKQYNSGHNGGVYQGKYELSGKVVCGYCGASYRRSSRKVSDGTIYEWFCSTYSSIGRKTVNQYKKNNSNENGHKDGCDNIRIKESDLLKMLGKVAEEYFGESKENSIMLEALKILKSVIEEMSDNSSVVKETGDIKREIENIMQKEDILLDKLLNGVISNEMYKAKQEQFTSDKKFLSDRLEQLENVEIDREILNQRMQSIENELSGGGMKKVTINTLLSFIERIVVYTDRIDIEISLSKMTGAYMTDILSNDTIKISEPIENYKQGYCETSMNRTKEMVYRAIRENDRIHIDEIAKATGLTKSMVNVRVRTLKQEGKIKSTGVRDGFRWIILEDDRGVAC